MVGSIVVVVALTHYALLKLCVCVCVCVCVCMCVCVLKATLKNVHCSLIWALMLYKFEQGHKAAEETENICCVKAEGKTDYPIYPTPPLGQDMTQGQFLSGV